MPSPRIKATLSRSQTPSTSPSHALSWGGTRSTLSMGNATSTTSMGTASKVGTASQSQANNGNNKPPKPDSKGPPFFNITRIRVPNYVARQRASHESTCGLYCILIEDNTKKRGLSKCCATAAKKSKCIGDGDPSMMSEKALRKRQRKRYLRHAELEANGAVTVRTRAVEDVSDPAWEQFTLRNKIVTPQPLFRIKNGGKLIVAVYKDLRGEDRPLTEGEIKVKDEGRIIVTGYPFDLEIVVSASSFRPFRIENCKVLNWRPKEPQLLWDPVVETHHLGNYDIPVDITDIMEKQFSTDIIMVYNTLFPCRRALGDFIWNDRKTFFLKWRRHQKRMERAENTNGTGKDGSKKQTKDDKVLSSLFGASIVAGSRRMIGGIGGSRRVLGRGGFDPTPDPASPSRAGSDLLATGGVAAFNTANINHNDSINSNTSHHQQHHSTFDQLSIHHGHSTINPGLNTLSLSPAARTLSTVANANSAEKYSEDRLFVTRQMIEKQLQELETKTLFLRRLFLCVATCGLASAEWSNSVSCHPWPFPVASMFGHGSRVLFQLEGVSAVDFLNFLFTGVWVDSGKKGGQAGVGGTGAAGTGTSGTAGSGGTGASGSTTAAPTSGTLIVDTSGLTGLSASSPTEKEKREGGGSKDKQVVKTNSNTERRGGISTEGTGSSDLRKQFKSPEIPSLYLNTDSSTSNNNSGTGLDLLSTSNTGFTTGSATVATVAMRDPTQFLQTALTAPASSMGGMDDSPSFGQDSGAVASAVAASTMMPSSSGTVVGKITGSTLLPSSLWGGSPFSSPNKSGVVGGMKGSKSGDLNKSSGGNLDMTPGGSGVGHGIHGGEITPGGSGSGGGSGGGGGNKDENDKYLLALEKAVAAGDAPDQVDQHLPKGFGLSETDKQVIARLKKFPLVKRVAATHRVEKIEVESGQKMLIEKAVKPYQARLGALNEGIQTLLDGRRGKHWGLDLPIGGVGALKKSGGQVGYVGLSGELCVVGDGMEYENSLNIGSGSGISSRRKTFSRKLGSMIGIDSKSMSISRGGSRSLTRNSKSVDMDGLWGNKGSNRSRSAASGGAGSDVDSVKREESDRSSRGVKGRISRMIYGLSPRKRISKLHKKKAGLFFERDDNTNGGDRSMKDGSSRKFGGNKSNISNRNLDSKRGQSRNYDKNGLSSIVAEADKKKLEEKMNKAMNKSGDKSGTADASSPSGRGKAGSRKGGKTDTTGAVVAAAVTSNTLLQDPDGFSSTDRQMSSTMSLTAEEIRGAGARFDDKQKNPDADGSDLGDNLLDGGGLGDLGELGELGDLGPGLGHDGGDDRKSGGGDHPDVGGAAAATSSVPLGVDEWEELQGIEKEFSQLRRSAARQSAADTEVTIDMSETVGMLDWIKSTVRFLVCGPRRSQRSKELAIIEVKPNNKEKRSIGTLSGRIKSFIGPLWGGGRWGGRGSGNGSGGSGRGGGGEQANSWRKFSGFFQTNDLASLNRGHPALRKDKFETNSNASSRSSVRSEGSQGPSLSGMPSTVKTASVESTNSVDGGLGVGVMNSNLSAMNSTGGGGGGLSGVMNSMSVGGMQSMFIQRAPKEKKILITKSGIQNGHLYIRIDEDVEDAVVDGNKDKDKDRTRDSRDGSMERDGSSVERDSGGGKESFGTGSSSSEEVVGSAEKEKKRGVMVDSSKGNSNLVSGEDGAVSSSLTTTDSHSGVNSRTSDKDITGGSRANTVGENTMNLAGSHTPAAKRGNTAASPSPVRHFRRLFSSPFKRSSGAFGSAALKAAKGVGSSVGGTGGVGSSVVGGVKSGKIGDGVKSGNMGSLTLGLSSKGFGPGGGFGGFGNSLLDDLDMHFVERCRRQLAQLVYDSSSFSTRSRSGSPSYSQGRGGGGKKHGGKESSNQDNNTTEVTFDGPPSVVALQSILEDTFGISSSGFGSGLAKTLEGFRSELQTGETRLVVQCTPVDEEDEEIGGVFGFHGYNARSNLEKAAGAVMATGKQESSDINDPENKTNAEASKDSKETGEDAEISRVNDLVGKALFMEEETNDPDDPNSNPFLEPETLLVGTGPASLSGATTGTDTGTGTGNGKNPNNSTNKESLNSGSVRSALSGGSSGRVIASTSTGGGGSMSSGTSAGDAVGADLRSGVENVPGHGQGNQTGPIDPAAEALLRQEEIADCVHALDNALVIGNGSLLLQNRDGKPIQLQLVRRVCPVVVVVKSKQRVLVRTCEINEDDRLVSTAPLLPGTKRWGKEAWDIGVRRMLAEDLRLLAGEIEDICPLRDGEWDESQAIKGSGIGVKAARVGFSEKGDSSPSKGVRISSPGGDRSEGGRRSVGRISTNRASRLFNGNNAGVDNEHVVSPGRSASEDSGVNSPRTDPGSPAESGKEKDERRSGFGQLVPTMGRRSRVSRNGGPDGAAVVTGVHSGGSGGGIEGRAERRGSFTKAISEFFLGGGVGSGNNGGNGFGNGAGNNNSLVLNLKSDPAESEPPCSKQEWKISKAVPGLFTHYKYTVCRVTVLPKTNWVYSYNNVQNANARKLSNHLSGTYSPSPHNGNGMGSPRSGFGNNSGDEINDDEHGFGMGAVGGGVGGVYNPAHDFMTGAQMATTFVTKRSTPLGVRTFYWEWRHEADKTLNILTLSKFGLGPYAERRPEEGDLRSLAYKGIQESSKKAREEEGKRLGSPHSPLLPSSPRTPGGNKKGKTNGGSSPGNNKNKDRDRVAGDSVLEKDDYYTNSNKHSSAADIDLPSPDISDFKMAPGLRGVIGEEAPERERAPERDRVNVTHTTATPGSGGGSGGPAGGGVKGDRRMGMLGGGDALGSDDFQESLAKALSEKQSDNKSKISTLGFGGLGFGKALGFKRSSAHNGDDAGDKGDKDNKENSGKGDKGDKDSTGNSGGSGTGSSGEEGGLDNNVISVDKKSSAVIHRRSLVADTHEAGFAEFWVEETLLQAKTCVSNLKFRPKNSNNTGNSPNSNSNNSHSGIGGNNSSSGGGVGPGGGGNSPGHAGHGGKSGGKNSHGGTGPNSDKFVSGIMGGSLGPNSDTPLFQPKSDASVGSASAAYSSSGGDVGNEPYYILPVPPNEECLILMLQRACEMDYIDREIYNKKVGIFKEIWDLTTDGSGGARGQGHDGLEGLHGGGGYGSVYGAGVYGGRLSSHTDDNLDSNKSQRDLDKKDVMGRMGLTIGGRSARGFTSTRNMAVLKSVSQNAPNTSPSGRTLLSARSLNPFSGGNNANNINNNGNNSSDCDKVQQVKSMLSTTSGPSQGILKNSLRHQNVGHVNSHISHVSSIAGISQRGALSNRDVNLQRDMDALGVEKTFSVDSNAGIDLFTYLHLQQNDDASFLEESSFLSSAARGRYTTSVALGRGFLRAVNEDGILDDDEDHDMVMNRQSSVAVRSMRSSFNFKRSSALGGLGIGRSGMGQNNSLMPAVGVEPSSTSGSSGTGAEKQHEKTFLRKLLQELLLRKCHLRLRSVNSETWGGSSRIKLERYVEPCLVCVCCEGKILVRTHEETEDGVVQERSTLLTTKKMPEESWQDAAQRACADELNVHGIDCSKANYQFVVEQQRGKGCAGLPGLSTSYGLHVVRIEVTQDFVDLNMNRNFRIGAGNGSGGNGGSAGGNAGSGGRRGSRTGGGMGLGRRFSRRLSGQSGVSGGTGNGSPGGRLDEDGQRRGVMFRMSRISHMSVGASVAAPAVASATGSVATASGSAAANGSMSMMSSRGISSRGVSSRGPMSLRSSRSISGWNSNSRNGGRNSIASSVGSMLSSRNSRILRGSRILGRGNKNGGGGDPFSVTGSRSQTLAGTLGSPGERGEIGELGSGAAKDGKGRKKSGEAYAAGDSDGDSDSNGEEGDRPHRTLSSMLLGDATDTGNDERAVDKDKENDDRYSHSGTSSKRVGNALLNDIELDVGSHGGSSGRSGRDLKKGTSGQGGGSSSSQAPFSPQEGSSEADFRVKNGSKDSFSDDRSSRVSIQRRGSLGVMSRLGALFGYGHVADRTSTAGGTRRSSRDDTDIFSPHSTLTGDSLNSPNGGEVDGDQDGHDQPMAVGKTSSIQSQNGGGRSSLVGAVGAAAAAPRRRFTMMRRKSASAKRQSVISTNSDEIESEHNNSDSDYGVGGTGSGGTHGHGHGHGHHGHHDSRFEKEDFEARPFECAFWTKVQTPFGTRTRYWNWHQLSDLDELNSKLFAESPLLYSSLIQLREIESTEQRELHSLLIGLEGSAPGKAGVAGKHDAGAKSKPYGAWCGLKWRYFGECIPPVPASVGGMRVSVTKPLLDLCERVCSRAVQSPEYIQIIDELVSKGFAKETPDSKEEKLFKNILKSDGRKAKEKVHEFIVRTRTTGTTTTRTVGSPGARMVPGAGGNDNRMGNGDNGGGNSTSKKNGDSNSSGGKNNENDTSGENTTGQGGEKENHSKESSTGKANSSGFESVNGPSSGGSASGSK